MKKKIILTLFLCFSFLILSVVGVSVYAEGDEVVENPKTEEVVETTESETEDVEKVDTDVVDAEEVKDDKLTEEEKDVIKENIDFYVKCIIEALIAALGSLSVILLALSKIAKCIKDMKEGKISQDEATKEIKAQKEVIEAESKKMVENNEKFVGELKEQYEKTLDTIREQNITINDLNSKVSKANLVIAEVITQVPELVSSGLTAKLLEIFNEGGVNNESKD